MNTKYSLVNAYFWHFSLLTKEESPEILKRKISYQQKKPELDSYYTSQWQP